MTGSRHAAPQVLCLEKPEQAAPFHSIPPSLVRHWTPQRTTGLIECWQRKDTLLASLGSPVAAWLQTQLCLALLEGKMTEHRTKEDTLNPASDTA